MNKKEQMRFQANRQLVHCTFVFLGCFILDCLKARNLHYRNPQERENKLREILADYFGNPERDGRLQCILNKAYGNILYHLKQEFPFLNRQQILIFSYYAAGLPVPLMTYLSGLSCDKAVSVLKTQMKKQLECHSSERKEEYLMLLQREKLPNWVRNAIFA